MGIVRPVWGWIRFGNVGFRRMGEGLGLKRGVMKPSMIVGIVALARHGKVDYAALKFGFVLRP